MPGIEAQLTGPGGTVVADNITYVDSSLALATFDMTGVAPGNYTLQVSQTLTYLSVTGDGVNPDSVSGDFVEVPQLDTAATTLSVMDGGGPQLSFELAVPTRVRAAREFEFELVMRNEGSNDAPAPLVLLQSDDGVDFVDSDLGFASANGLLLILPASEERPSVIRPGRTETYLLKAIAPAASIGPHDQFRHMLQWQP